MIPLFYDRDADGIPHGWCEMIKEALDHLRPDLHDGADDGRVRDEDLHAADDASARSAEPPSAHRLIRAAPALNGCSSSSPSCTTPQLDSGTAFHAPVEVAERLRDDDARLVRELGEARVVGVQRAELVEARRVVERARVALARVAERPEPLAVGGRDGHLHRELDAVPATDLLDEADHPLDRARHVVLEPEREREVEHRLGVGRALDDGNSAAPIASRSSRITGS